MPVKILCSKSCLFFILLFSLGNPSAQNYLFLKSFAAQDNLKKVEASICGHFTVNGIVRRDEEGHHFLVVAEGSKSQNIMEVKFPADHSLFPYVELPVTAEVIVAEPPDGTNWKIKKIKDVYLRASNPLKGAEDSFIRHENDGPCVAKE